MQAFKQPRLVKFESTGIAANALLVKSGQQALDAKAIGKRFLAILLTCLSAWGA